MNPIQKSQAGTFESSDILVLIEPVPDKTGRIIEFTSSVMLQYGDNLNIIINDMLNKFEVEDIRIIINDKGALEPTIRARIETALNRSFGKQIGTLI